MHYRVVLDILIFPFQLDVDRPFFPPPKFFDNKGVTTSSLALANDLLALGSSHNEVIAEQDIATARLLSMPKLPYGSSLLTRCTGFFSSGKTEKTVEGLRVTVFGENTTK